MLTFDENELQWAEDIFRKIDAKMEKTLSRTQGVIPYRVENGRFENMAGKKHLLVDQRLLGRAAVAAVQPHRQASLPRSRAAGGSPSGWSFPELSPAAP